ncbi:alpha/beta hydrolase [Agromyces rhizosphaerae]|uniref:Alpha/beta hydrolase n=1 Tax=Agromyces rhizosphaerae TaxID=88374 RepID=A0A9W6FNG5_9MICO|nr:alpha/beta fold hydrolase [Agromyces rhizosphaerae]GLI26954.1 alpha/beta hydrolase [Agromyces rhizosphaerae]
MAGPTGTERDLATTGGSLHYRRRGRAGAPALLMLHGISDGGAVWTRVADEFVDRFDIVMPDARGHGLSRRVHGEISVPLLAADAISLIEGLRLAPVRIWGHSLGASTAAQVAAMRPDLVAAVVLEDPPFLDAPPVPASGGGDDPRSRFLTLLEKMAAIPTEARIALAREANPHWHDSELAPWAETKAQFDPAALALYASLGRDWRSVAARVRCPALLLTGDAHLGGRVTADVAAEAVGLMARGELVHVADAGHNVHRDRFDEALAAAGGFLGQLEP